MDMEWLILENQESEFDECAECPYKRIETCRNQCMEEKLIYNQNLPRA